MSVRSSRSLQTMSKSEFSAHSTMKEYASVGLQPRDEHVAHVCAGIRAKNADTEVFLHVGESRHGVVEAVVVAARNRVARAPRISGTQDP
eukprot:6024161-Pleurochrysis_carterae.AAC.1